MTITFMIVPLPIGDYALTHNPGLVAKSHANGLYNSDRPEMIDNTQYCNYSSTWLLTKITAPTNEWISFNYVDNGLITYQSNRTFSANLPDIIDMRIPLYWSYVWIFLFYFSFTSSRRSRQNDYEVSSSSNIYSYL